MKKIYLVLGILIIIGVFAWLLLRKPNPIAVNNNPTSLEEQSDSQGAVTIKVTPLNLISDDTQWRFKIELDTHSVALSQDLVANSQIVDNMGKIYKPVTWEGDAAGGHHRQGTLVFNAISPAPQSITLKINGIEQEREFKWSLKSN